MWIIVPEDADAKGLEKKIVVPGYVVAEEFKNRIEEFRVWFSQA